MDANRYLRLLHLRHKLVLQEDQELADDIYFVLNEMWEGMNESEQQKAWKEFKKPGFFSKNQT